MVMPPGAAMSSNRLHLLSQDVVIGEQRAAIAVTAERFGRKKTGAADSGNSATAATSLSCAEALRRIFNNREAMPGGNRIDAIVIGHLTEQTDRQQSFGARSNSCLEQVHVNVVCGSVNIHKNRPGPDQTNYLGSTDPGKGNSDDFVARSDPKCAQGDFKACCSARDGEADRKSTRLNSSHGYISY